MQCILKKIHIWAKKKFENQCQVKTQFFHHNFIWSCLSDGRDCDCVPRTSSRSAWNSEDATWARGKANEGLNTRSQLRKHTAWRARWCSLGCWTGKSPNSGWIAAPVCERLASPNSESRSHRNAYEGTSAEMTDCPWLKWNGLLR